MKWKYLVWFFSFSYFFIGLTACSSTPERVVFSTTYQTVSKINPDINGRPSPISVVIYQLKSPASFKNSNFFSLYSEPLKALGGNLLDMQSVEVQPHRTKKVNYDLFPGTHYIGIIAGYRDIQRANWRALIPVATQKITNLTIALGMLGMNAKIS